MPRKNPAAMPFHLIFGVNFGLKGAHNPPAFPARAKWPPSLVTVVDTCDTGYRITWLSLLWLVAQNFTCLLEKKHHIPSGYD